MTRRKQHQSKKQNAGSQKKLWWIICLIILAVVAFSGYKFMVTSSGDKAPKTPAVDYEIKSINPSILTGRWLRPDGGYVLQLGDIGPNGQMRAQYFNPNSINVSSARWKEKDGRLDIFVELRDVNYPGSTYTLKYYSSSDRMRGIYYQAAMQQQFDVEFVRLK